MRHLKGLFIILAMAVFLTALGCGSSSDSSADATLAMKYVRVTPVAMETLSEYPAGDASSILTLFDGDTSTAFNPTTAVKVRVGLPENQPLSRIKIFGSASAVIKVYESNGETETERADLNPAGRLQSGQWISIETTRPLTAKYVIIEITPDGVFNEGVREIEFWTEGVKVEGGVRQNLYEVEGVAGLNETLFAAPHVVLTSQAEPTEVSIKDVESGTGVFRFSLTQQPSVFTRAYLVVETKNVFRPVSLARRINNLSWTGGLAIPEAKVNSDSWSTQVEEINPGWLVKGENIVEFKSPLGPAVLRNARLILEKDSGWNHIVTASNMALIDGNADTVQAVDATGTNNYIEAGFDRTVEVEELHVYVKGTTSTRMKVQCLVDAVWREVQIDATQGTVVNGWNRLQVTSPVQASAVRVFFEGGAQVNVAEIRACASPVGSVNRIVVGYPRNGEYFGRTAYIRGFAIPAVNGEGGSDITIEGKKASTEVKDGAFCTVLTKDETRFAYQSDSGEWKPVVSAHYLEGSGASTVASSGAMYNALFSQEEGTTRELSREVRLFSNYSQSTTTGGSGQGTGSTSGSGTTSGGTTGSEDSLTETISPTSSKSIYFRGVTIEIPAGAVDSATSITVIPLSESDVSGLNPGMVNVTYPAAGYRFLFNGQKHGSFKKPIKISFAYTKERLVQGQGDGDVRMYYYHESEMRWKTLTRVADDVALARSQTGYSASVSGSSTTGVVTSETTHFTDIINATLVVPEHPDALSYNPNTIKDLKAADPAAGVSLIDPPSANADGDASIEYQIPLPKGRNGLHPQLAVKYNSSGGNGWLGHGWDIAVQSVGIDTRWGVPRYNGSEEYLLGGQPLVKDAEGNYRLRREGSFQRIVRLGTGPGNYHWVVTDKNGTRNYYGASGPSRLSNPRSGDGGRIFQWFLERTVDANGNTVEYEYEQDSGGGGSAGEVWVWKYPRRITYTGYTGGLPGPYTVDFFNDEVNRNDVTVSARGGFKTVMRKRLSRIEVRYNGAPIRTIGFEYTTGFFHKTLLSGIIHYAEDGSTVVDRHRFEYYDDVTGADGRIELFSGTTDVWTGAKSVSGSLFVGSKETYALGGSEGKSDSLSAYVGFSPFNNKKGLSLGFGGGRSNSTKETVLALMDIDGDGIADQIYHGGGGLAYRAGKVSENGGYYFDEGKTIVGLEHAPLDVKSMDYEKTSSKTIGARMYLQGPTAGASAFYDVTWSETEGRSYFADVDGDGLADYVRGGSVKFNSLQSARPVFIDQSPNAFNSDGLSAPQAGDFGKSDEDEAAEYFYLDDPLLMWKAPFSGKVRIHGNVKLTQTPDPTYLTADGARASIWRCSSESGPVTMLWSEELEYGDAPKPAEVGWTQVKAGDEYFFRLNSIYDGSYDEVAWDPVIEYDVPASMADDVDFNGNPMYRYRLSDDFSMAGASTPWIVPVEGDVRVSWTVTKENDTSDDAVLKIVRVTQDGNVQKRETLESIEIPWNDKPNGEEGNIVVSGLVPGDSLEFTLTSDTPIDYTGISWKPEILYINRPEGEPEMKFTPSIITDLYVPQFDETVYPYVSLKMGEAKMVFTARAIKTLEPGYETTLTFAVKRKNGLVRKCQGTIREGSTSLRLEEYIDLDFGDELYFVCASDRDDLDGCVVVDMPRIYYTDDATINPYTGNVYRPYTTVRDYLYYKKTAVSPFAGGYRNWYYSRWRGERDTLDRTKMVFPPELDYSVQENIDALSEHLKNFTTMVPSNPDITGGGERFWTGHDPDCRIGKGYMRSTRTIEKYLTPKDQEPPSSGGGGAGRGVEKKVKAKHWGAGASFNMSAGEQNDIGIGGGGTVTEGWSVGYVGLFDFNGDRFPDMVRGSSVQFTDGKGSLGGRTYAGYDTDGISKNTNKNINTNIGANVDNSVDATKPDQNNETMGQEKSRAGSNYGVSGTAGAGISRTSREFADVNGDGLPDMVYVSGLEGSAARINLGYALGAEEPFHAGAYSRTRTASIGIQPGLGYSKDKNAFGGGTSFTCSQSGTEVTYIDVNGDGLPDRVRKELGIHPTDGITVKGGGSPFRVCFNTGSGFSDEVSVHGGFSDEAPMANRTYSQNASVSATIDITVILPLIVPVWIGNVKINPSVSVGKEVGRVQVRMQDVNGDGLPDHVYSNSAGELKVRLNRYGKTNLLKKVTRSLGGSFALEYRRMGNTQKMPQSRWVMSKVTVSDGMEALDAGSGSVHRYSSEYTYKDGTYDRNEREFYGFREVKELRPDGSSMMRTFLNENYFTKGFEDESEFRDKAGNLYTKTKNTYFRRTPDVVPVSLHDWGRYTSRYYFLNTKETFYYEGGNEAVIATKEAYSYDDYGNVSAFTDYGDVNDLTDDVRAQIEYSYKTATYVMNRPSVIRVFDAGGTLLRKREGLYDTRGNLIEHKTSLDEETEAVVNLAYNTYGNLVTFTGPDNLRGQRYRLNYTYDGETQTYVTSVRDSFGLTSSARYEYKYGNLMYSTDTNGNSMAYSYDNRGRVRKVTGPYDFGGSLPTVASTYRDAEVEESSGNIMRPTAAFTSNLEETGSTRTLDVYTFVDGFKRPVQVRKTAEVKGVKGMIVSGRSIYDALGREIMTGQPEFSTSTSTDYLPIYGVKNPTVSTFDVMGRKTQVRFPDGSTVVSAYGFDDGTPKRFLTTTTDPMGKMKQTVKNPNGLITSVKEKLNGQWITTRYEYNGVNEIVKVTDAKGNETKIVYDMAGRRLSIDNPDAGLTSYRYDRVGNLTVKITPNLRQLGTSIKYVYTYNRLERTAYPGMNDVYYTYGEPGESYNRAGRLKSVDNGTVKDMPYYGKLGELVKQERTLTVPADTGSVTRTYTSKYRYDNFGRMRSLTLPDNEEIRYEYDGGGLVKKATGYASNATTVYVQSILYDEFGQRVKVVSGNGIETTYEYDELTRRLMTLKAVRTATNSVYMNVAYEYDKAGNILSRTNTDFTMVTDEKKTSRQEYAYDDLHRLVTSGGSYDKEGLIFSTRVNSYTNEFTYDVIGNFVKKIQDNTALYPDGKKSTVAATTYTFDYKYETNRPHAVTSTGVQNYTHDASGNMLTSTDVASGGVRYMAWDDENRLLSVVDPTAKTEFKYDHSGMRVLKTGANGIIQYVNNNYTVRDNEIASSHVFAGNTRVATKVITKSDKQVKGIYYYHGDHLGSSNFITNKLGNFHEHIEYFPYGETWVEEKVASGETLPYKFTSKELDPETGLYYFGARYYEPRTAVWGSVDPALPKYFPTGKKETDENLPGIGGIFNPQNIGLYSFTHHNPVKYYDPDGNSPDAFVVETSASVAVLCAGAAVIYSWQYATNSDFRRAHNSFWGGMGNAVASTAEWTWNKTAGRLLASDSSDNRTISISIPNIEQIRNRSNNRLIVIGENMPERVIPTATALSARYYHPRIIEGYLDAVHKPISLARNRRWIIDRIREGYSFIDVGRDNNNNPSDWYNMELSTIAEYQNRGYRVNVINIESMIPPGTPNRRR